MQINNIIELGKAMAEHPDAEFRFNNGSGRYRVDQGFLRRAPDGSLLLTPGVGNFPITMLLPAPPRDVGKEPWVGDVVETGRSGRQFTVNAVTAEGVMLLWLDGRVFSWSRGEWAKCVADGYFKVITRAEAPHA